MTNIYPNISVVMSVYNGEKYLRDAIESILNQSFTDFEFIIIDDGSTDRSLEIIQSYADDRIKLIQQENKGLAAALNEGIKIARGKYIARMDADDISYHQRIEKQFDFMEQNPGCVALGTNAIVITEKGEKLYTSEQPETWNEIKRKLPQSPFFHSSVMMKKDVVIKCGCYHKKLFVAQDALLFNLMAKYGFLRNIAIPLIKYRLVPNALSNRDKITSQLISLIVTDTLKTGAVNNEKLRQLNRSEKKKSNRWKTSNYYLRIGKVYIERNFQKRRAANNLFKSLLYYPLNGKAWFNLVLLLFPKVVIKRWKRHRGVY